MRLLLLFVDTMGLDILPRGRYSENVPARHCGNNREHCLFRTRPSTPPSINHTVRAWSCSLPFSLIMKSPLLAILLAHTARGFAPRPSQALQPQQSVLALSEKRSYTTPVESRPTRRTTDNASPRSNRPQGRPPANRPNFMLQNPMKVVPIVEQTPAETEDELYAADERRQSRGGRPGGGDRGPRQRNNNRDNSFPVASANGETTTAAPDLTAGGYKQPSDNGMLCNHSPFLFFSPHTTHSFPHTQFQKACPHQE